MTEKNLKERMKKPNLKEVHPGDVFTFIGVDHLYKAILCIQVDKTKSPFYYKFAALTFSRAEKPSREELINGEFYGNTNRRYYPEYHSKELVEHMWAIHPETKPYYLCAYQLMILRKEFNRLYNDLEWITRLPIIFENTHVGCRITRVDTLGRLQTFFLSGIQKEIDLYFTIPFKVKALIKE
jgi:hypothetical protein